MRKLLYIILLIAISSCNKQKAQLKRIEGTWTVELARVLDGEGFTFYDSLPNGEIHISSDLKTISGRIDFDYLHFGANQVIDSFVTVQAAFTMNEKGDHLLVVRETDTIDIRILLSSKKNLEFEYYDDQQYRLRRFALRKN
jgi:hypothetical protein